MSWFCLGVILLLAVFGFCCAVRLLSEWLFGSDRITVAIQIKDEKDADMLELLLHEARSAFFKKSALCPVVLVSVELMDGTLGVGEELYEEYAALLQHYGAECYLIDP